MNKHLSMLFAAAVVLYAAPAFATCPTTTPTGPCDDVTTVLTAPITTETAEDSTTNTPPASIFIESTGGVHVSRAAPAVTVNSNNWLINDGTIENKNTTGAVGVLIDAGGASNTIDTTLTPPSLGVDNEGTIDLSGSGSQKVGIEFTDGTMVGPLTLGVSSITKVTGDGSSAVSVTSTGVLQGDMNLEGSIVVAGADSTVLSNASPSNIVDVGAGGVVNGDINIATTAVLQSTGADANGILVFGSVCSAAGCAGTPTSGQSIGTITNAGTIIVAGAAAGSSSSSSTKPESGIALYVNGPVQGGIVNAGPLAPGDGLTIAQIEGSGFTIGGATPIFQPVVSIVATTATVTVGADTLDTTMASFINRGNITALPANDNASATTFNIEGASQSVLAILSGGFYSSGYIAATATSTTGATATNPSATAILFDDWSKVPTVVISGTTAQAGSTLGSVAASVSGAEGGRATDIFFTALANGGDPNGLTNVGTTTIQIGSGARLTAVASTINPSTVTVLDAVGIIDQSGTVTEIDNAGTIIASVTTLTSSPLSAGFSNYAHAIDLSANTVGGIKFNNAGTIVGDVLLNSGQTGASPTIVNIGAGGTSDTGDAEQTTQAADARNATGVTNSADVLASLTGALHFGTGTSDLYINDYGTVSGAVVAAQSGILNIDIAGQGTLNVENTFATGGLTVQTLNDYGGLLGVAVDDSLRVNGIAAITASTAGGVINLAANSRFAVSFASFIPQGDDTYVLLKGPVAGFAEPLNMSDFQQSTEGGLPFFFNSNVAGCASDSTKCALQFVTVSGSNEIVLNVTPKTAAQLGLTGDAASMFGPANVALLTDPQLGAAVVNATTHTTSQALGQQTYENIYSQFAPDVSGNERAIAIALTDEATGPVAARQRMLRMYANQDGDFTLWGQEYGQFINDKATLSSGGLNNFKDHGFGFSMGADGGDPIDGWYGAAATFFSGDATEIAPRDAKAETDWYMLTGYTDWRGHHLFLDTQISAALANIKGKRFLTIMSPTTANVTLASREADSKTVGLLGAVGATTGAIFNWGNLFLMPQVSLDGLALREDGYTETGGGVGNSGDAFDLTTQASYATSLRTFIGADSRIDVDLGDFLLQPEARLGYRFDFLNDPVKVRAAFAADPTDSFTLTGPDPSRGNVVAGATIGASTETWSMGLNFDWVRGSNGSTTEVGTFNLLGRI